MKRGFRIRWARMWPGVECVCASDVCMWSFSTRPRFKRDGGVLLLERVRTRLLEERLFDAWNGSSNFFAIWFGAPPAIFAGQLNKINSQAGPSTGYNAGACTPELCLGLAASHLRNALHTTSILQAVAKYCQIH
jgi:hypothetical protein